MSIRINENEAGKGLETASRQAEKSFNTRSLVLRSTVNLIRDEGLSAASPNRITQKAGMSWGAVQHHFGSKEQLLKTIVLLARDQFDEVASAQDYSGLDLAERISLFVDLACRHYQSDIFLAAMEISFWHRNKGIEVEEDLFRDDGRTSSMIRSLLETVFHGLAVDVERLVEAHRYMHCVMAGLAFYTILDGRETYISQQLAHCKTAMLTIITPAPEGA